MRACAPPGRPRRFCPRRIRARACSRRCASAAEAASAALAGDARAAGGQRPTPPGAHRGAARRDADRSRAARPRAPPRARPPSAVADLLAAAQAEAARPARARGRPGRREPARALPRCLSRAQGGGARARLRRPPGARLRAARARRRSAPRCASASTSCSWTSSRTRTACSAACSTRSSAPTASASSSATPASRSTASATRTSSCSASAASAPQARLPLTGSYRSRPELLTVIGHVFGRALRRARLRAALRPADGGADGRAGGRAAPGRERRRDRCARGRRASSRPQALARRLRELVDAGEVAPGEIAILLRSARDASIYAGALERVGLAAHSQLGRGFYRSQQVRDLCAYLALLRNRFDDHALLVVLASPLVGVSNDGLSALRTAAQAALYWPIELGQLDGLPEGDRALVERFKKLYDGLVRAGGELGLAALLERIVLEHDYELACLTAPDGERRFGNVRKLVRTARAYERDRGPDLAGFVDQMRLCDERDLSEADAPPGGGEDAVALMTIHAAKGLEFAVVCVPDLSRQTPGESGAVAVGQDGAARAPPARRARQGARAGPSTRASSAAVEGRRRGRGRPRRLRGLDAGARSPAARRLAGRQDEQRAPARARPVRSRGGSARAGRHRRRRRRRAGARARAHGRIPGRAPGACRTDRGARRDSPPTASSASSMRLRSWRLRRSTCRRRSSRCPPRRCTCRGRSPTARSPCTTAVASRTTPSA